MKNLNKRFKHKLYEFITTDYNTMMGKTTDVATLADLGGVRGVLNTPLSFHLKN